MKPLKMAERTPQVLNRRGLKSHREGQPIPLYTLNLNATRTKVLNVVCMFRKSP